MNGRRTRVLWTATVAGLACVLVVGFLRGAPQALVSVLAGGLVGAWAHVYVRCMCASRPLVLRSLERAIATGALASPAVVLLGWLVGPAVWVVLAVGAVVWAAAVTDDGHLHSPTLAGHGLRIPGIGRHA